MPSPTADEWNTLNQTFSLCTCILLTVYVFCVLWGMDLDIHPPEDAMFNKIGIIQGFRASRTRAKATSPKIADTEANTVTAEAIAPPRREDRVVANNTENIPLHYGVLVFAWIMTNLCNLSGSSGKAETQALTIIIACYVGFRTLYVIFYLGGFQPWRSFAFMLATFTAMAASGVAVSAAFGFHAAKFVR